jgi:hypothetical protein
LNCRIEISQSKFVLVFFCHEFSLNFSYRFRYTIKQSRNVLQDFWMHRMAFVERINELFACDYDAQGDDFYVDTRANEMKTNSLESATAATQSSSQNSSTFLMKLKSSNRKIHEILSQKFPIVKIDFPRNKMRKVEQWILRKFSLSSLTFDAETFIKWENVHHVAMFCSATFIDNNKNGDENRKTIKSKKEIEFSCINEAHKSSRVEIAKLPERLDAMLLKTSQINFN